MDEACCIKYLLYGIDFLNFWQIFPFLQHSTKFFQSPFQYPPILISMRCLVYFPEIQEQHIRN